jgi:hypothetical protein
MAEPTTYMTTREATTLADDLSQYGGKHCHRPVRGSLCPGAHGRHRVAAAMTLALYQSNGPRGAADARNSARRVQAAVFPAELHRPLSEGALKVLKDGKGVAQVLMMAAQSRRSRWPRCANRAAVRLLW